jgi:hypothetical protein
VITLRRGSSPPHFCSLALSDVSPIEAHDLADSVCGPAADLREEFAVFLGGLQDPNSEASRQRVDERGRRRPRTNNLSAQKNRRRSIPWAKTNRDDGTYGR